VDWLAQFLSVIVDTPITYLPFVGIGIFTWVLWLLRYIKSWAFKSATESFKASTSVVIPIYKEKESVVKRTLQRVLANKPDEVIVVIDAGNGWEPEKILDLCRREFPSVKPIMIKEPGKRPALAKGIRFASGDIVVLVDSDTYWMGDDFLQELIKPFADPKVGAVASRQNVENGKGNVLTRISDWWLDVKYLDYMPGNGAEGCVTCVSGRTAAYRRSLILPLLPDLLNERFLGRLCVGGDDGRLTSLILKAGYKTCYQPEARANTVFPSNFKDFVKQHIRWSRNTYRCYFRAIKEGWIFSLHWIAPLSVIHTLVAPFSLVSSVVFMAYAVFRQDWFVLALLSIWALLGRGIKGISHLRTKRIDVLLLPILETCNRIVYTSIKVYALFTCHWQDWLGTRGDYSLEERWETYGANR